MVDASIGSELMTQHTADTAGELDPSLFPSCIPTNRATTSYSRNCYSDGLQLPHHPRLDALMVSKESTFTPIPVQVLLLYYHYMKEKKSEKTTLHSSEGDLLALLPVSNKDIPKASKSAIAQNGPSMNAISTTQRGSHGSPRLRQKYAISLGANDTDPTNQYKLMDGPNDRSKLTGRENSADNKHRPYDLQSRGNSFEQNSRHHGGRHSLGGDFKPPLSDKNRQSSKTPLWAREENCPINISDMKSYASRHRELLGRPEQYDKDPSLKMWCENVTKSVEDQLGLPFHQTTMYKSMNNMSRLERVPDHRGVEKSKLDSGPPLKSNLTFTRNQGLSIDQTTEFQFFPPTTQSIHPMTTPLDAAAPDGILDTMPPYSVLRRKVFRESNEFVDYPLSLHSDPNDMKSQTLHSNRDTFSRSMESPLMNPAYFDEADLATQHEYQAHYNHLRNSPERFDRAGLIHFFRHFFPHIDKSRLETMTAAEFLDQLDQAWTRSQPHKPFQASPSAGLDAGFPLIDHKKTHLISSPQQSARVPSWYKDKDPEVLSLNSHLNKNSSSFILPGKQIDTQLTVADQLSHTSLCTSEPIHSPQIKDEGLLIHSKDSHYHLEQLHSARKMTCCAQPSFTCQCVDPVTDPFESLKTNGIHQDPVIAQHNDISLVCAEEDSIEAMKRDKPTNSHRETNNILMQIRKERGMPFQTTTVDSIYQILDQRARHEHHNKDTWEVPSMANADVKSFRMTDRIWEYRDLNGKIQGLFTSQQMRQWFEGNFFAPGLYMRYDRNLSFIPFCELYPPHLYSVFPPFLKLPHVSPAGLIRHDIGESKSNPLPPPPPQTVQKTRAEIATHGLKTLLRIGQLEDEGLPDIQPCNVSSQSPVYHQVIDQDIKKEQDSAYPPLLSERHSADTDHSQSYKKVDDSKPSAKNSVNVSHETPEVSQRSSDAEHKTNEHATDSLPKKQESKFRSRKHKSNHSEAQSVENQDTQSNFVVVKKKSQRQNVHSPTNAKVAVKKCPVANHPHPDEKVVEKAEAAPQMRETLKKPKTWNVPTVPIATNDSFLYEATLPDDYMKFKHRLKGPSSSNQSNGAIMKPSQKIKKTTRSLQDFMKHEMKQTPQKPAWNLVPVSCKVPSDSAFHSKYNFREYD